MKTEADVLIIGGGPAGLSAAYELVKSDKKVVVLEKLSTVGGLARTIEHNKYLFDIGPHRFYTKNKEMQELFLDILGQDAIEVNRLTRILYKGKYFDYPLTPLNALFGLGVVESFLILFSYLFASIKRVILKNKVENFEDWVVDQFGYRLYSNFFKNYTEKVWGIECNKIGKDWASQRIKGLSLMSAIRYSLFPNSSKRPKSLVDKFYYPKFGAGMLWEKLEDRVVGLGGVVEKNREVINISKSDKGYNVTSRDQKGKEYTFSCQQIFFSCALKDFFNLINLDIPKEVIDAGSNLQYRNHISVHLVINEKLFPDNWIYIHSPDLKLARVSDFSNFSEHMTYNENFPLTLEYFCFEDDEVWNLSEEELIQLAFDEVLELNKKLSQGLVLVDSSVTRNRKAYPVIVKGYEKNIDLIRGWLETLPSISPIGRSGMFKYNNQDHAMATGIYAARTYLGLGNFDPWLVNVDGEYIEEIS